MKQSGSVDLDEVDRRLLNEVQRDNGRPVAVIADIVGLSASACYRRLQRLRNDGVIVREAAIVDQRRSPWPLTVIVELSMERMNEPVRAGFEAKIQRVPQILQCFSVSGDADFVLVVAAADVEDYREFARDVLISDEHIKTFRSTFALKRLKSQTLIEF